MMLMVNLRKIKMSVQDVRALTTFLHLIKDQL